MQAGCRQTGSSRISSFITGSSVTWTGLVMTHYNNAWGVLSRSLRHIIYTCWLFWQGCAACKHVTKSPFRKFLMNMFQESAWKICSHSRPLGLLGFTVFLELARVNEVTSLVTTCCWHWVSLTLKLHISFIFLYFLKTYQVLGAVGFCEF